MVERLASLLGIFFLLGIGYAFSRNRRRIPWRLVVTGILLQIYLALFIVRTDWVPVLLTAVAGVCAAVLAAGLVRAVPGFWTPAARGLGLLGVLTAVIHLAVRHEA
ncbi:MAG: Na+ dependent nucleoside transporter N-terminal domain-containing protein, partial [Planctomycetota bacterium]